MNGVFNPAAAEVAGETVLLARVEDRRGISHLTVARSANGIDGWTVDREPLLAPDEDTASEQWGFEDARVVWVDELERWVITCTAYGPAGPAVFLATTEDFTTVERYGVVRHPEDKNAALLPHRIDGRWVLLHRPKTQFGGGARRDPPLALGRSRQLERARASAPAARQAPGGTRCGSASAHRRSEQNTVGCSSTTASRRRSPATSTGSGLVLLDLDEPTQVLRRLPTWVLGPHEPYERTGDVPNVVFPCGLVHDAASDEVRLYYGAADSSICLATSRLADLLDAVLAAPADA